MSVISILGAVLLVGILIYMGIIYESTSLALLGCATAVLAVLSLCTLLAGYFGMKILLEIPISMAQQGQQVQVKLIRKLYGQKQHGRVKVKLLIQNTSLNQKYCVKQILNGKDSDTFSLRVENAGRYEIQIAYVKIYDILGMLSLKKRERQFVSFVVLPTIYPANIRVTEAARNFCGEAEVYDLIKGGHDPSETLKLRPFRDGDKLQNIHWKLSAKTERLIVREKSFPRACVAVLLLMPHEEKKVLTDAYIRIVASISFSLMDAECAHFVAWYSTGWQDVVRMRVDDEESFYECFLQLLEELSAKPVLDVEARYQEKFGSEVILHRFLLKGNLTLYQNQVLTVKLKGDDVEKALAETELLI